MSRVELQLPKSTELNLTSVLIVANSNIAFWLKNDYLKFRSEMSTLVRKKLLENDLSVEDVFGESPEVEKIVVRSFGVEIGAKQRRGHFNLAVEIWHHVPKYSVGKLRERIKDWLDLAYSDSKGWNVNVRLTDQRHVNYSNKEERWNANDEVEETDELRRLSDQRDLVQEISEMGTAIRKLVIQ